jgi:hypothetical protein
MRTRQVKRLVLNRESLRQLERNEIERARGAADGTLAGSGCPSCHLHCTNYTLWPQCGAA